MSEEELNQIRAAAESVMERARNDEAFLAELREDPITVLQAAGVPEGEARQIGLDELTFGDEEVAGFAKAACKATCDRYSCIVSICSNWSLLGGTN